jgi:hypothetical protein
LIVDKTIKDTLDSQKSQNDFAKKSHQEITKLVNEKIAAQNSLTLESKKEIKQYVSEVQTSPRRPSQRIGGNEKADGITCSAK